MFKRKTKSAKRKVKTQSLKFLVLSFSFTFFALRFTLCMAQSISSTELIENAALYDGKTVVYEGEVIGDIMVRGKFAWINVNDGQNALGIWVHASLLNDIAFSGSYKSIGDGVEITGIFHRACPEHGGDLDIHAQAMRKAGSGRAIQQRLNPGKRNLAVFLLGVLFLVWILSKLKQK